METANQFTKMKARVNKFASTIHNEKLKKMFEACFYNTIDTTTEFCPDGTTYIITGDINAMWLRDSSAQVMQYLPFAKEDEDVRRLLKGLLARQFGYIQTDPYANSFSVVHNDYAAQDECEKREGVWERKFELDSLCYPLWLAYHYYEETKDSAIFDQNFLKTLDLILSVFTTEQRHKANSYYYHYRPQEVPELSVPNRGRGGEVKECGLVWSGYRPSDDPCVYGYFIPGNLFICSVFKKLLSLKKDVVFGEQRLGTMQSFVTVIGQAVQTYGITEVEGFGKIYAYETDALGHYNLMDDANVPSLLGLPYLDCVAADDEVYRNTRAFVLSKNNPYYYEGKALVGIGSPHTPKGFIWPISLIIQGLTSNDRTEINKMISLLMASDADTNLMHEGIDKDNPQNYTRSWFAWANSLFSLFILKKASWIEGIKGEGK